MAKSLLGERREHLVFIEITKINTRNEEGKALINTDNIVGMCQQPNHFTRLYNEDQELVSETQDTPRFAVLTNCGQTYVVSESEYTRLVGILTTK